jgi:hypothetical protein
MADASYDHHVNTVWVRGLLGVNRPRAGREMGSEWYLVTAIYLDWIDDRNTLSKKYKKNTCQ